MGTMFGLSVLAVGPRLVGGPMEELPFHRLPFPLPSVLPRLVTAIFSLMLD